MKRSTILALLAILTVIAIADGCSRGKSNQPATPATPSTSNQPTTFQSPGGKSYTVTQSGPRDSDEPVNIPTPLPGERPSGDNFHGTARMAAKLSMATGTPQEFTDLGDLLDSLPSDQNMRAMGIDSGPGSGRLPEELKLVTVTAFLFAISKESDNDFHCIFGRAPNQTERFMNVEVSALPPPNSPFFLLIKSARDQFKQFFSGGNNVLPSSGYEKFDPPIPVKLTGSLFFDVDHVPPAVGPTGMKPQTAWEIHPVKEIIFEPQS